MTQENKATTNTPPAAEHQPTPDENYRLGLEYFRGEGRAKDLKEGVRLYHLAAANGHRNAQYELGMCYWIGNGVVGNRAHALDWIRLAAEQGHADAQHDLARCYEDGRGGVAKDLKEAVRYYRLSANQRHESASWRLPRCERAATKQKIDQLNKDGDKLCTDNRHHEAVIIYEKAIKLDPKYAGTYCLLADDHLAMRRYHEAKGYYNKAKQLDPENPDASNGYHNACGLQRKWHDYMRLRFGTQNGKTSNTGQELTVIKIRKGGGNESSDHSPSQKNSIELPLSYTQGRFFQKSRQDEKGMGDPNTKLIFSQT